MARILIVEDQELVRSTIKVVLERAGHSIAVAADGIDGLQQFRQAEFAAVICDVFMPGKDGLATLQELRAISGDVPVIMISGGSMRPLRAGDAHNLDYLKMATDLGATRTIAKPFNTRDLTAAVDEVLAAPTSAPLQ
jgi:CheY-like chemotaxis protein